MDTLDGFFICDVAAYAVMGVGGVRDEAALL